MIGVRLIAFSYRRVIIIIIIIIFRQRLTAGPTSHVQTCNKTILSDKTVHWTYLKHTRIKNTKNTAKTWSLLLLTAVSVMCSGCKAERLACSNSYIYALDTTGELVVRLGVSSSNKRWHKVPGALNTIAGNCTMLVTCLTFLTSFRNIIIILVTGASVLGVCVCRTVIFQF